MLNRSVTNVTNVIREGDTIEEDYESSHGNIVSTKMEPTIVNVSSASTFESMTVAENSERESTGKKRTKITETLTEILNKKNKERNCLMTKTEKSEDSIDIFFKSMALTVKQFSPEFKIRAKMDVLKIINELELQNLKSSDQNSSTSNYVFPENLTSNP